MHATLHSDIVRGLPRVPHLRASGQPSELEFTDPPARCPRGSRIAKRTKNRCDALRLSQPVPYKDLACLAFYLRRACSPSQPPPIEDPAICASQRLILAIQQVGSIARLAAGMTGLAYEYCSNLAAFGCWDAMIQAITSTYKVYIAGDARVMQICGGVAKCVDLHLMDTRCQRPGTQCGCLVFFFCFFSMAGR